MLIRAKFVLAIISCLSLTMYVGGAYLQKLQQEILEQEARDRVKIVLNFTHATRSYVEKKLRPALERELHGKILFEGMSATSVTHALIEIFRETMPNYVYKQAALNPLNLANQADDFETQLIKAFQQNLALSETTGYRQLNDQELFYFAQPVRVESACLQCHGQPQNVPKELTDKYGNTHGFAWKEGEIISALMLYVPTQDLRKQAATLFNALLTSFVVLTVVIIVIVYFLFDKLLITSQKLKTSFEHLEEKNQQLEHANQLKNEFLGIAAHDLKNPLSVILGAAQDISDCCDEMSKEEVLEYASMIQLTSRQMFELISNLLEVNAIESTQIRLTLKSVNIILTVHSVLYGYEHHAKTKNIKFRLESDNCCKAYIDESVLRQVFDNLISNAVKYSPFHSEIIIRFKELENKVFCEIQDQGEGLSVADQQKLFNKFARLTPRPTANENSTGLGLFIVKKLVEAMNGQVSCRSELGKGSTFIVELPRHPPAAHTLI